MTVIAVIVLAVWALGTIAITAGFILFGRDHPFVDAALFTDPVRVCLAMALVAVFWPAAFTALALQHLTKRDHR